MPQAMQVAESQINHLHALLLGKLKNGGTADFTGRAHLRKSS
jgi:hypothetical protein